MPQADAAARVRRSWRTPDALWAQIEPLLPPGKPHPLGCHNPRVDDRRAMDAIFFRLRTGCQWNALSATGLCSSSSAHQRFQEWRAAGVFLELWRRGLTEYDALKGIDWRWLAADGAMTKAPLGGKTTGRNPTDRGKRGTKRSLLTDAAGVPLGITVAGANRHDVMLLAATLASIPVPPPGRPRIGRRASASTRATTSPGCTGCSPTRASRPHVRAVREDALARRRGTRARRWVVERTHSWMNRVRALLVRWDKKTANYEGGLHLASAYISFARAGLLG